MIIASKVFFCTDSEGLELFSYIEFIDIGADINDIQKPVSEANFGFTEIFQIYTFPFNLFRKNVFTNQTP